MKFSLDAGLSFNAGFGFNLKKAPSKIKQITNKPKMGQRLGQYDFAILLGILTPSGSNSIWFHTIIN